MQPWTLLEGFPITQGCGKEPGSDDHDHGLTDRIDGEQGETSAWQARLEQKAPDRDHGVEPEDQKGGLQERGYLLLFETPEADQTIGEDHGDGHAAGFEQGRAGAVGP